ncbi:uncharacterized protein LOC133291353 [Gastrolobium bilobum]|uniref:uncharacterized protein LOC133291353 n=1 Tax=Gastrolobium bilobum TaxID=150636 RepID=UPI002AB0045C|nr:uncharacterized protein LOC133291353 [Gastrolobium bilobum]
MDDETIQRQLNAFRKNNPPAFKGTYDPIVTAKWLLALEKIFKVMRCRDQLKLLYATYMLQDEANDWWTNAIQPLELQGQEITWALFEGIFLDMYFTREDMESKEKEFLELKQGSMTIDQYLAEFNELKKYANYRRALPTPTDLAAKFQWGLCEKIAKMVLVYTSRDFSTLVRQCKFVEGVYSSYKKSSNVKEPDPKGTTSKMPSWKNNKGKNLQVK